jgi:hypothetical protein
LWYLNKKVPILREAFKNIILKLALAASHQRHNNFLIVIFIGCPSAFEVTVTVFVNGPLCSVVYFYSITL